MQYSIVVPAHNEEKYISKTLRSLASLHHKYYEVIVVENGSTDKTYTLAKKFSSPKIKVYRLKKKGVSAARNYGARKTSKKSQWLVFLDADTILQKGFLTELDQFLGKKSGQYVIGTTTVLPIERSPLTLLWFSYYNTIHQYWKKSFSIQIVKKKLFGKVIYDETLRMSEDIKMIQELRKYGRFFFLKTKSVMTSTRRFRQIGWMRLAIKWAFHGVMISEKERKKIEYEVVR